MIIAPLLCAQTYDLLLKGGHVLDPANNVDAVLDVAISGNRIARVAPEISAKEAKKSVDVAGTVCHAGACRSARTCLRRWASERSISR